MPEFSYTDMLPTGADDTEYRLLTTDGVRVQQALGRDFLQVEPEVLTQLTTAAMHDIAHLLRPAHLRQLRSILDDPEASRNDKFVAGDLLKNACIAVGGILPMCQDTGTAIVMGKRGGQVLTDGWDEHHIARGIYDAYTRLNLRYSQLAPLTMWEERNTGSNLPAQIELYATEGGEYKFLFMAKGGGSANKSYLYQETKAVLSPARMAASVPRPARPTTSPSSWAARAPSTRSRPPSTPRPSTWTRCRRPVRWTRTASATSSSRSRSWTSRAGPGSAPSSAASTSATTCA
jgi:fumarate hydratase class I